MIKNDNNDTTDNSDSAHNSGGTSGGGSSSQTTNAKGQTGSDVKPDPGEGDETKTFWQKLADINALFGSISNYENLLLLALAFVVFFGGAGFLISMFSYRTRAYFFNSRAYTIYYVGLVLLLAIVVAHAKKMLDNSTLVLMGGFLIGAIAIYVISKLLQRVNRDLP